MLEERVVCVVELVGQVAAQLSLIIVKVKKFVDLVYLVLVADGVKRILLRLRSQLYRPREVALNLVDSVC